MVTNFKINIERFVVTQYCAGDIIENNEMGGACSAHGGEERRIQRFREET